MILLMIIRDFNIIRIAIAPFKTYPPLIVDPYAVLAFPARVPAEEHWDWSRPIGALPISQLCDFVSHRNGEVSDSQVFCGHL